MTFRMRKWMTSQISFILHVLKNECFENKTIAKYRDTDCECVFLKVYFQITFY